MREGQRSSAVEEFSETLRSGGASCGILFLGLLIIVLALVASSAVIAFRRIKIGSSCSPASSLYPTIRPALYPIDCSKMPCRHLETLRSSSFEAVGYHEVCPPHRRGRSLLGCDRMLHPSLIGTHEWNEIAVEVSNSLL